MAQDNLLTSYKKLLPHFVAISLLLVNSCNLTEERTSNNPNQSTSHSNNAIEKLLSNFVFVEGGCFQMGDTLGDGTADERPVHTVCLDDFYLGKYEVSQAEWESVMGYNPSKFKISQDHPVENISWNEALKFIEKLNSLTGNKFRLPTEAEWEFAARSRGKITRFPWGNSLGKNNANCRNCGSKWDNQSTSPVGSFKPNDLGIFDMAGNVYEWCTDFYSEDYYANSITNNPKGPSTGKAHVDRGASWKSRVINIRTTNRAASKPDSRNDHLGFRLVLIKSE